MNEQIKRIEDVFKQTVEELTQVKDDVIASLVSVGEPLKVGDKVKFLGPVEEFNDEVTVGKVYEIHEIDFEGNALFNDDSETSFISSRTRHLFEKVDEPKYKTEKRTPHIGECILIVNADDTLGQYENGDVGVVIGYGRDSRNVRVKGWDMIVFYDEYEVIT